MGSRSSKQSGNPTHRAKKGKGKGKGKGKVQAPQISGPTGGLQMIPTPRPGTASTIYVAGGAVNTIYLRSRHTTGDVDFFGANEQSRLLKDASKYAQQRSQVQLGANWFNNSMSLFLGRDLEQELMLASRQQGTVLFAKPGLTVYAVPWEYALCGKADRLTKPTKRPYDTADAVAYLHQCVNANGRYAIQAHQVEAWARKYNKEVSVNVLKEINSAFKSKYGHHGILF